MTDTSLVPIILLAVLIAAVFVRMAALEQRLQKLSRLDAKLDAKLDALLKHAGVIFDPYRDVPQAVADAVGRGKKIEAIKAYRQATGADLRDAKEYVEELQRRSTT